MLYSNFVRTTVTRQSGAEYTLMKKWLNDVGAYCKGFDFAIKTKHFNLIYFIINMPCCACKTWAGSSWVEKCEICWISTLELTPWEKYKDTLHEQGSRCVEYAAVQLVLYAGRVLEQSTLVPWHTHVREEATHQKAERHQSDGATAVSGALSPCWQRWPPPGCPCLWRPQTRPCRRHWQWWKTSQRFSQCLCQWLEFFQQQHQTWTTPELWTGKCLQVHKKPH